MAESCAHVCLALAGKPSNEQQLSDSPEGTATGDETPIAAAIGALVSQLPPIKQKFEVPVSSPGGMRRNLTAAAALSSAADSEKDSSPSASGMRRNTSASTLSELRQREQQSTKLALAGSCQTVIEAVACKLLEQVLGKEGMLAAMRENRASQSIPEENAPAAAFSSSSSPGSPVESSGSRRPSGEVPDAAGSTNSTSTIVPPPGISAMLQSYIHTIVKHLELPNSCIVAALIYVMRAIEGSSRFSLSLTNWQPCLLAAFVIAAKLSFDEPVWNEDFVKALRISNVQVSQISRWEADFLQLLSYNTNVTVAQYAAMCFDLQKAHEQLHQKPCHFFTYLMSLSAPQ